MDFQPVNEEVSIITQSYEVARMTVVATGEEDGTVFAIVEGCPALGVDVGRYSIMERIPLRSEKFQFEYIPVTDDRFDAVCYAFEAWRERAG